ncbi:MAG TPA: hypothetical protein VJ731_11350 [Terriglobales bacterium]|nr:hypothetical protein [Terriglobales bacterium]
MKDPHDVIDPKPESVNLAIRPGVRDEVDPARAADIRKHEGRTYYFCSKNCAERFSAKPRD